MLTGTGYLLFFVSLMVHTGVNMAAIIRDIDRKGSNQPMPGYDCGIDPIFPSDKDINQALLLACRLNNLSPNQLHPYIPNKAGLRNTFAFKCLLNVYVYPRQTKTFYAKHFHLCQTATAKAIAYLITLGYIKSIGRPRLILPFQAYKVDTAYQLTISGKMVIKKIVDSAVE